MAFPVKNGRLIAQITFVAPCSFKNPIALSKVPPVPSISSARKATLPLTSPSNFTDFILVECASCVTIE